MSISRTSLLAAVAAGAMTVAASADLVAYWNFNSFDPASDLTIAADSGLGTVDLSNWGGGVASFAGTTENSLFGDPSGGSLSLQGGEPLDGGGFAGNGTFIDVSFSMVDLQDAVLSFATRGTGTGFNSGIWSWSVDGVDFLEVDGVNTSSNSSAWAVREVDLSSIAAIDDAAMVTLRYTLDGATSSAGNNRLDNLQINATIIPAPGAVALLGLSGLIAGRRRRGN